MSTYHAPGKAKKKPKKKTGLIVTLIIIIVLFIGAVAGFFFLKSNDALPLWGQAPTPTITNGEIQAMALSPTPEITTEDGFHSYFNNAITYAKENNLNTLIFDAKSDMTVYWRDAFFPVADEISEQDTFFNKLDPLAILCEEAEGTDIQIWVKVDPYSTAGYSENMKGKVAKLFSTSTETTSFAANNEEYSTLLTKSLSRLPHKYPIAGILFDGLGATFPAKETTGTFESDFSSTLQTIKNNWLTQDYKTQMFLNINPTDTFLTKDGINALSNQNTVQGITAEFTAGKNFADEITTWNQLQAPVVTVVPEQQGDVVLFVSATEQNYNGAVLGNFSDLQGNETKLALLKSTTLDSGTLPTGFDIPQTLGVQYPTEKEKIYWNQVYITGSSDPNVSLYLDGVEVQNRSPKGTFGVLVTLAEGNNVFTFTQEGQESVVRTIIKPSATGGGSSGSGLTNDSTIEAKPGQAVRINTLIASGLTKPGDDSAINETFTQGGVAIVQESVQTVRNGKYTWAYKLTSGDYVLAYNCVWVNSGTSAFTGLTILPPAETNPARSEVIQFEGTGTPASYISFDNDSKQLTITMYNTTFALVDPFTSEYITGANVENIENGVELTLNTQNLWGYQLEYEENTTRLYLKGKPTISSNSEQPLTGITVMLDAGHGDTDIGAYGLLNTEGLYEKDVNLQLAQATAYRLRQMGATVIMTRDDDSFPSLTDRLQMQMEQKPDFFIALHHDAVDPNRDLTDVKGISCYYYHPYNTPPSKDYAQNLLSSVANATGREGKTGWGYYYVTRTTVCPSVLFEYGFLNNPIDFAIVTDKTEIYTAACATADGILATVQQANQ